MIYVAIMNVIRLCIDPSMIATSGSAAEILDAASLNTIYISMFNVPRLRNMIVPRIHLFLYLEAVEYYQSTKYDYAWIHLHLYLQVLLKCWNLRLSSPSTFRYSSYDKYDIRFYIECREALFSLHYYSEMVESLISLEMLVKDFSEPCDGAQYNIWPFWAYPRLSQYVYWLRLS